MGAPSAEDVAAMAKCHEELTRAGVLLALDGLHPALFALLPLGDPEHQATGR